jgi:hypothetical protein
MWKQFGATIDMLENAVTACPDSLWNTESRFWYNAYHTIFYLDYYLSTEPEKFFPPLPFTLSEFDPVGILPDRVYTKNELLNYIEHCRRKCYDLITGLTRENADRRFVNEYKNFNILEMMIYNMRHVQHHAGQLNMLLRQNNIDAPRWVSQTQRTY